MRITTEMILTTTLQDLQNNQQRIATFQGQLSSGKQLTNVSDDPVAAARILALRTNIDTNTQYLKNIDSATSWLSSTDTALSGVNSVVTRAQELAVQGASSTLSTTDRQAIATEVDSLVAQIGQLGNSTNQGSYIFAGAQTDAQPFTVANGAVTYNNTDPATATKQLSRVIGPGTQVGVNTVGHDPTTQNGVLDQVFSALTALSGALKANNTTAISSNIAQLSSVQTTVSTAQANVGATMNRVTTASGQLQALQTQLAAWRSNLEDTNFAQAATNYAEADVVQKATLASMSKTIPPTLFDYMA